MSTTTPNPDAGPGHVPGWAAVEEDELERHDDELLEEGTPAPATPGPESSSPSPSPSAPGPLDDGEGASSTPGSRPTEEFENLESGAELSQYLEAELEELGASALDVAGRVLNRLYRRRTQTESRLWLATEEEAEAFGAAAARIAQRHMPEELAEDGDPADALVLGSVALGYVLRNTAGIEAPAPEGQQLPDTSGVDLEEARARAAAYAEQEAAFRRGQEAGARNPAPTIAPAPSPITPDL